MKSFPFKIFFSAFLFCSCFSLAQTNPDIKRTYHWYFGNKVGIDFSTGTAIADTNNKMNSVEGCAVISDTCGDLLFYTNGDIVWDRNHQIMPNGTGLISGWSSTERVIIVPMPQSSTKYYIFTTTHASQSPNGMYYHTVDMSLNTGLGDVVTKNILLFTPTTEKLCATNHANGQDIWVVGKELNSNRKLAYLITNSGINPPIISANGAGGASIGDGYMRVSPNGKKVAAAYHTGGGGVVDTIDVYDFDNTTGILSNPINIAYDTAEVYGLCFSPDNTKLYISMYKVAVSPFKLEVYQYDLSSGIPATILASRALIASSSTIGFYAIQLRPDGKIFISHDHSGLSYTDSLATLYNPNAVGVASNFVLNDFYLQRSSSVSGFPIFGLPNFVDSYFNSPWISPCTQGVNELQVSDINLFPNPFTNYTTVSLPVACNISNVAFKIIDVVGENVTHAFSLKQDRNNIFILNVNTALSGVFIIQVSVYGKIYSAKIIITKT